MLLAIDQGTTGTTCLVVDEELRPGGRGYGRSGSTFPQPGWVEHDPRSLGSVLEAAATPRRRGRRLGATALDAIGIANQRETTVVWERAHGRAGRTTRSSGRTAARRSAAASFPPTSIRERTGLVPDPYFSATKLEWLLDARRAAASSRFGTVDSWLLWRLTAATCTPPT